MGFANDTEVRRYLGGIFEKAAGDDELGPQLRATGLKLRFVYTDPASAFIFDFATGELLADSDDVQTDAVMSMSADTGNAYWQGKVNLPLAMAKGKIKVVGNIAALLKLAPLTKKLFPAYVEMLGADSRSDLVL